MSEVGDKHTRCPPLKDTDILDFILCCLGSVNIGRCFEVDLFFIKLTKNKSTSKDFISNFLVT